MATSKAKKRKKRQQAQHRQQHDVAKSRERDQHREHLPKTGTRKDDEYLFRRSREDIADFGLARSKGGWLNWVIGVVVALTLASLIVWTVWLR